MGGTAGKPPKGFSVVHADAPFAPGLRGFFEYRDLGIAAVTAGSVGARVIRARPGGAAEPVWHRHELAFQMVYVLRGWVVFEYEGVGEKSACYPAPASISRRASATAKSPTPTIWNCWRSPCRPSSRRWRPEAGLARGSTTELRRPRRIATTRSADRCRLVQHLSHRPRESGMSLT